MIHYASRQDLAKTRIKDANQWISQTCNTFRKEKLFIYVKGGVCTRQWMSPLFLVNFFQK